MSTTKYSVELQPEVRAPGENGKPGKVIKKARIVEFKRLSMSEWMQSHELGGKSSSEFVVALKRRMAGMKLAILSDRGKPLNYEALLDQNAWDARFNVKESQALLYAFGLVHDVEEADLDRAKNSLRTISG